MSQLENIIDHFKLPIFYNDKKIKLDENIKLDLELIQNDSNISMYNYVFNNNNESNSNTFSNLLLNTWTEYYTTDEHFLRETQDLILNYIPVTNILNTDINNEKIISTWKEIKLEGGFKEKFGYLDWDKWDYLNDEELFLQLMGMYNLTSPFISIIIPLIVVIVPFFILKFKGMHININEYFKIVKNIIKNNAVYKLFTDFTQVDTYNKIYLLISSFLYLFSFYQNILTGIRYDSNMKKIHYDFSIIHNYLSNTINSMNDLLLLTNKLDSYISFSDTITKNKLILEKFNNQFDKITEYKLLSMTKINQIGLVMKMYYEFYNNKQLNDAMLYSFGFNGFINHLANLKSNIHKNKLNKTNYIKHKNKNKIINNYYPAINYKDPVITNNIKLQKNIIITGPNASGKTTILKSVLLNIILGQQIGYGFYTKFNLKPYDFLYSYLNIPDTSNRDSLFQAEARRCKNIINNVTENKSKLHFCIFDELFSGTNPEDAVISATAFVEFISNIKTVNSMTTTHYTKICDNLDKNKYIENKYMETLKENDNLINTYKIKSGISNVHSGIKILTDMNYPENIIKNCIN